MAANKIAETKKPTEKRAATIPVFKYTEMVASSFESFSDTFFSKQLFYCIPILGHLSSPRHKPEIFKPQNL